MMKCNRFNRFIQSTFLLCFAFVIQASDRQYRPSSIKPSKPVIDDYWHFHDVGNLALTITNYGVIGEGYNNPDQPSCMYKYHADNMREQIEHMSYGGLWIGGRGGQDGAVHVSTAIVDGVFEAGEEGFEFTNSSADADTILERSSIVTSPFFDPHAISHQDFLCDFTDVYLQVPGTDIEIPEHTPLGLRVHLESYAWNFSYTDGFVILNYTITNVSANPIMEIYAGFWADAAIGNMNYTNIYEPGGGWSWYDNLNGFDDSYKMGYQYDDNGDDGFAESYFGIRYLGSSGPQETVTVNYDQWQWSSTSSTDFPDYVMPLDDEARYEVMKGRHTGKYYNSPENGGYPTSADDAASWMLILNAGSLGDLDPGESLNFTYAIVCAPWATKDNADSPARREFLRLNSDWAQIAYNGEDVDGDGKLDKDEDINDNGLLDEDEDLDEDGVLDIDEDVYNNRLRGIEAGNGFIDRYILPSPPPSPNLLVIPAEGQVTLFWNNISEMFEDPITREQDFEGYRIYSAPKTAGTAAEWSLLAEFDRDTLNVGYNTGFQAVRFDTVIQGQTYQYRFVNDKLLSGWPGAYWFAVTAFDRGNPQNNLPSLESSILENKTYAVVGSPAADPARAGLKVTVFPNPYRAQAEWDGSGERDRLIWFANLPAHAKLRIFTMSGDLVDEIIHRGESYSGEDVQRISRETGSNMILPGGLHAWDLISAFDQAVATGLYFFSVEDLDTGDLQSGKFVVIK